MLKLDAAARSWVYHIHDSCLSRPKDLRALAKEPRFYLASAPQMDHSPSNKDHIANAALGQGVGYGIVVGLGLVFALGTTTQASLGRGTII
jgi:hypothetical protein